MGRLLGVDFGEKRIGLAISDENKRIALPWKTILAKKKDEETAKLLQSEIKERGDTIDLIILGLPLHLNGKESPLSLRVRKFATVLAQVIDIPIEFLDERLTSKSADSALREQDLSRKKRKVHVDNSAAAILLQNYLDKSAFN